MTGFPDRPEGRGGDGERGSGRRRPVPGSPPLGIFSSLVVRQPREGYRFSLDSVLLADFAADYCGERVLDLGTGAGVILLLLAGIRTDLREGVGVEIQEELWRAAVENIGENGLSGRLSARLGDFREKIPGLRAGSFHLVVSNPPFRRIGEGRRNPDRGKEIARHEVACTYPELFAAARRHLAPRGAFVMVSPAARIPEILALAAASGLAPAALRLVHPFADAPANRVLFAGIRGASRDPVFLPPLVVYAEPGRYHPETERILAGRRR